MTRHELNVLINSWPEGTRGHARDARAVEALDAIGAEMGYGWLEQVAHYLYLIQCHKTGREAADLKRGRLAQLGWPLPADFEEVARRTG